MYTACYCSVVLGAAGSSLKKQLNAGDSVDAYIVAVLAIGGFFGLFTALMTMTSWNYIFTNSTNVDMLGAKSKVYQLAVRVPRGSQATDKYHTVTYPLSNTGERVENGAVTASQVHPGVAAGAPAQSPPGRDALAARTFAILKTEPGENPWDLGLWQNWQYIMGENVLDWFLPIRRSPCVNHDSDESFYRMGQVVTALRARNGIDELSADETDNMELRDLNRNTI
jgi:palmitoyltransferase